MGKIAVMADDDEKPADLDAPPPARPRPAHRPGPGMAGDQAALIERWEQNYLAFMLRCPELTVNDKAGILLSAARKKARAVRRQPRSPDAPTPEPLQLDTGAAAAPRKDEPCGPQSIPETGSSASAETPQEPADADLLAEAEEKGEAAVTRLFAKPARSGPRT